MPDPPEYKLRRKKAVILLHGVGSNEEDLFRFANRFPEEFMVISVRAPHTISTGRYAWFELNYSTAGKPIINPEQAEKSRLQINTFINELTARYGIEKNNIFLGGFSQGGIMSYSVGLTFPQNLAGIFILSSRLLPEVKPLIRPREELKDLEIFVAHGRSDQVLPLNYAHEALAYLQTLTDNVTYHEYDMIHTTSEQELADLVNWLEEKNA
ncbi:MAG: esterase [Sphingobacteriaceae bacterium]|nr:MAG: esterase [Sphingobacteriaceae bacterium]